MTNWVLAWPPENTETRPSPWRYIQDEISGDQTVMTATHADLAAYSVLATVATGLLMLVGQAIECRSRRGCEVGTG